MLIKFPDASKLGGVANRNKIQVCLDRLENRRNVNKMNVNRGKCKVLHLLGKRNENLVCKTGEKCLHGSRTRHLAVFKQSMSQLGCVGKGEGPAVFCLDLIPPAVLPPVLSGTV